MLYALAALEQGLLYALMAIGVYLTFRVLNYADLTVDGSLQPEGRLLPALFSLAAWLATAAAVIGAAGGIDHRAAAYRF